MTDSAERGLLTVAAVGAGAIVLSIASAVVLGQDISDAVWFLLVPVGMLGGGVVAVVALAMFLARRTRSSTARH